MFMSTRISVSVVELVLISDLCFCPEIYDWDDEGRAQTTCDDIPEDLEECAQEALESCPVDAIKQTE